MNECGKASRHGELRCVKNGAWPLAVLLAAIAVQPLLSAGTERSPSVNSLSNRTDGREAMAEPVPPAQPLSDPELAHARLFLGNCFPSAKACGECHPKHYREWSISQHAYAQMSPVFNAMNGRLLQLSNGTLGDFCIRCHSPVGMALNEPIFMSNIDRHPVSREGITYIACFCVNQTFGEVCVDDES